MRPKFWEQVPLAEMTPEEWEALCDGCGKCCLVKLIDEDTEKLHFTDVACRGLNCQTGYCSFYERRKIEVPECLVLDMETLEETESWLPSTCAYKRLFKQQPLPDWHPLLTGDAATVGHAGVSVGGRVISEATVADADLEDHIVDWPDAERV